MRSQNSRLCIIVRRGTGDIGKNTVQRHYSSSLHFFLRTGKFPCWVRRFGSRWCLHNVQHCASYPAYTFENDYIYICRTAMTVATVLSMPNCDAGPALYRKYRVISLSRCCTVVHAILSAPSSQPRLAQDVLKICEKGKSGETCDMHSVRSPDWRHG